MPTIPLYFHTQSGAPGGHGVRASPGMAGALDGAQAQLQETLSGLKMQLQQTRDFRAKTELELAREERWGQFQESLRERGQEDSWVADWEKSTQGLAKEYLQGVSPQARAQLEFEQRAWEQKTRLAVQGLATQRGIEVATKVAHEAANTAWDRGDEAGAMEIYRQMVDRRLLDERLVDSLAEKGRTRAQMQQAMHEMNTEPIEMLERLLARDKEGRPLNWKNLSEEQRYTLENHARQRASEYRRQIYRELDERMAGGEVIGDRELDELVERRVLKAQDVELLKKRRAAGGLSPESIEFMELFHRARHYDPARDVKQEVADRIMAESLGLSDFDRRRLWAIIEEARGGPRGGGGGGGSGSGGRTSEARKQGREEIQRRFLAGVYGSGLDGTGMPAEEEERVRVKRRAQMYDELERFMEQNPQATETQVHDFLDEAEARLRKHSLARDLLGVAGLSSTGGPAAAAASMSAAAGGRGGWVPASPLSIAQVGADNAAIERILSKEDGEEDGK